MLNYNPKVTTEYVKAALTVLYDCGIKLSNQQMEEINALPTEMAVDRYKRKLILDSIDRR